MAKTIFGDADVKQIEDHGLSLGEVERQLELFKKPPPYQKLARPCTPRDGITVLDPDYANSLEKYYDKEAPDRQCIKFVPASGAATRMFKILIRYGNRPNALNMDTIAREADAGRKEAQSLLEFVHNIDRFAFFEALKSVLSQQGHDPGKVLEGADLSKLLPCLLDSSGLGYANLPKGLLLFHAYPEKSRTAFEEHLVEAASYVLNRNGVCPLHFTVSEEHLELFEALLKDIKPIYEKRYKVSFRIRFSVQQNATDTLAVDLDNIPFREDNGRLLFRPGGHGALLNNLNDIEVDMVFIKNIDNVVPDRLKPETIKWKKILGGYLIQIQNRIFRFLAKLSEGNQAPSFLNEGMQFAKDELFISVPESLKGASSEDKKAFLFGTLNRPVRVCGMVRNVAEPGGGPFWVQDQSGIISPQIVEGAQINPDSQEQQAIMASSTHFNPVDIVCGVRDWKGRAFDLKRYVNPEAVFITRKSKAGRDLKALEHPGLWNGSMAGWISIFVEAPLITFNPVKTVNDLIRDTHQP